jgi:hypothetical protein
MTKLMSPKAGSFKKEKTHEDFSVARKGFGYFINNQT